MNCIGCKNIKDKYFPFERLYLHDDDKRFWIDTELCGKTQDGSQYLEIFYCPVCGKILKDNK